MSNSSNDQTVQNPAATPEISSGPAIQVNTALAQVAGGQKYEINLKTTAEQVRLADGSNVAMRLNTLEKAVSGQTNNYIKDNLAERDAILGLKAGDQCWVIDATADPTVEKGGAKYLYMMDNTWLKIGEAESLDIVCDWSHIQNKPQSAVADIDLAVAKQHVHANADVLSHFSDDGAGNVLYKGMRINDGLVWVARVSSYDEIPANLADGGLVLCDMPSGGADESETTESTEGTETAGGTEG